MVVPGLNIELFEFQEKAVINLLDLTTKKDGKQTIVMKAPTGSGKTIILIDYVDKYLSNVSENTAFIWLCPGKGNLEEQSRDKMHKFASGRKTQNLFDALLNGFESGSTTFINWELVTKRDNTAIRDSERKNLFDRIGDAHRKGI
jgi:type III restriction enzyme